MSIPELERDVLSLRCWLRRSVLPTALILLVALLVISKGDEKLRDHAGVLAGFFAFYLVVVRGGHILMIRSLHAELKTKYLDAYVERLQPLPGLKGRNAGFALARIKRNMIDDGIIPNPNAFDKKTPNSRG
jgi:hypothetical protein